MPELPEVETIRRGLERVVRGATINGVEVFRDSCVRLLPGGPAEFSAALTGMSVASVARRGKFLWLALDDDAAVDDAGQREPVDALSAHLGMSGQFRVHRAGQDDAPEPHAHCRARLYLSLRRKQLTVDFLDQRTFGYLNVEPLVPTPDAGAGGVGTEQARVPASVAHIARDVLDPALDTPSTMRALRRGRRGIKQVLLDQTVVSGVGNIYADEALWRARIHPERPASALASQQAADLLGALRKVMSAAVLLGGTSFDALYVNVNGESGYFARELSAYGRAGEPCGRCGGLIARERIGGRGTHWCPRCQRAWRTRSVAVGANTRAGAPAE